MSHVQLICLTYIYYFFLLPVMAKNCPKFDVCGQNVGKVTSPDINEASGLVASQVNNGLFWTLNDKTGPNCIYALKMDGSLTKIICLEGAENIDWEAISTAHCTKQ